MSLRTNSPRVRYPVSWARVMGERPRTWVAAASDSSAPSVRTADLMGTYGGRRMPILPTRLRSASVPGPDYAQPHSHRLADGSLAACRRCDPQHKAKSDI